MTQKKPISRNANIHSVLGVAVKVPNSAAVSDAVKLYENKAGVVAFLQRVGKKVDGVLSNFAQDNQDLKAGNNLPSPHLSSTPTRKP